MSVTCSIVCLVAAVITAARAPSSSPTASISCQKTNGSAMSWLMAARSRLPSGALLLVDSRGPVRQQAHAQCLAPFESRELCPGCDVGASAAGGQWATLSGTRFPAPLAPAALPVAVVSRRSWRCFSSMFCCIKALRAGSLHRARCVCAASSLRTSFVFSRSCVSISSCAHSFCQRTTQSAIRPSAQHRRARAHAVAPRARGACLTAGDAPSGTMLARDRTSRMMIPYSMVYGFVPRARPELARAVLLPTVAVVSGGDAGGGRGTMGSTARCAVQLVS